MGNWLSKIDPRRAKKREPQTPPKYEVTCACGTKMVGLRRERYQQVLCKTCGEALFVLPINVYPEPPPEKPRAQEITPTPPPLPASGDTSGVASAPEDDLLAELDGESKRREKARILGEDASPAPPPIPKKQTRKQRREQARQKKAEAKRRKQENPLTAREPIGRKLRRVFSPFRVVVVSIIGLVAATVAWQVHQRNVDLARLRFENDRKDAITAMANDDFASAGTLFASAADAADLIGRDDVGANRVRRLAFETEVINDLCHRSLFDAIQATSGARGGAAAQRVVDELGDEYIVVETQVVADGRTEDGQRFRIELPLFFNDTLIDAEVIGGEFERLGATKSTTVVFAGKVKAARFGQRKRQDFLMLTFDPDSVRLWTDGRTLKAVGLAPEGETLQTLARQAELFGIK